MFVLYICLLLLIMWTLSYKMRRRQFEKQVNQFDGPPSRMIFGNSLMFPTSATDICLTFLRLNKSFKEEAYRVWLFHRAYVVIHYLKDARIVCKMPQKDDSYDFVGDMIGNGLLTSSGDKWKKTRTILDPSFNTRALNESILAVFNDKNQQMLQLLKTENKGTYFNMRPYIYRLAIFSLYENIMGFSEEKIDNDCDTFLETKDRCGDLIMKRIFSPWLHPHICFKAYLYLTGQSDIFDKCRSFFVKAIQKKKQLRNQPIHKKDNERKAIIDILMDTHTFSDDELTDEILTFLFAGTETTVTTVCFTLLMLAQYPDIQKIVYEEIQKVFGDSTRAPDAIDLTQLTFLEQCVKETMRKFTIVPTILRKATVDTPVSDGRGIPAGAHVYLSIHAIHHDPDLYPNPDAWNPRNFDAEKIMKRPANSFLPFGIGPRMCIGYKYAMMSVKVTLAMIIRNFEISTNQTDFALDFGMVLKNKDGYFLKLTDRQ